MLTTKQLAGEAGREPPKVGSYGAEEEYDKELQWRTKETEQTDERPD